MAILECADQDAPRAILLPQRIWNYSQWRQGGVSLPAADFKACLLKGRFRCVRAAACQCRTRDAQALAPVVLGMPAIAVHPLPDLALSSRALGPDNYKSNKSQHILLFDCCLI